MAGERAAQCGSSDGSFPAALPSLTLAPLCTHLHAAQFIHKFWAPLAEYVKAQEHGTLAYEIAIADSDPLKIQVFERWVGGWMSEWLGGWLAGWRVAGLSGWLTWCMKCHV